MKINPVFAGFSIFAIVSVLISARSGWEWTIPILAAAFIIAAYVDDAVIPKSKLTPVDPNPAIAYVDGPRPYDAVRAGDRVMVSEVVDSVAETYSTSRWLDTDEVPLVIGALAGDSYGSGRIELIERKSTGEIFR